MQYQCRIDVGYFLTRSSLLTEYTAQLAQLRETCTQRLAAFPPRLREMGETLLQRYAGHWQGVEWIEPLVLSAAWSTPRDWSHTIALANALTVMHAHICTGTMDDFPRQNGNFVPFASLLHTHMLYQYQQLFPPSSCFWRLLDGYHLEWAEATLWEQERQWGPVEQYSEEDTLRLAGVRALLKISGAASALLVGNKQAIMPLSSVLDHIHVALQLVDGMLNWREDLRARRATYFLTEVALTRNAQEMTSLERLNLEDFLATSSLPGKVIQRAAKHFSAAKKVANRLHAPALVTYVDELCAACEKIPHQWERGLANSWTTIESAPVSASL